MPCPLQKMSTQKMWRSLFTYCIDQLGFLGKMVNNSLFWEAICSTMDCSNIFTVTIEIYCYQTLLVSQKNQFPATFSSTFHSKESLLPLPWGNPPFASLNQGWGDALILSECTRGFLERMHTLVLYTKALYLAQSRGQQQQNKLSLCRTRRIKCETEGKLIRCSSAAHERTLQPGESLTFEQRTHFGESMHGT